MARHEPCSIKGEKKISFVGSPIFGLKKNVTSIGGEGEKRKKRRELLSSIYGVPSIGIRLAKNESSSTQ